MQSKGSDTKKPTIFNSIQILILIYKKNSDTELQFNINIINSNPNKEYAKLRSTISMIRTNHVVSLRILRPNHTFKLCSHISKLSVGLIDRFDGKNSGTHGYGTKQLHNNQIIIGRFSPDSIARFPSIAIQCPNWLFNNLGLVRWMFLALQSYSHQPNRHVLEEFSGGNCQLKNQNRNAARAFLDRKIHSRFPVPE